MIKFIEIVVNPYNGDIEHLIELGAPFESAESVLTVSNAPAIPVAVPPADPLPQLQYVIKRFCVDCDSPVNAGDLLAMLEDTSPDSPADLPSVKAGAPNKNSIKKVMKYVSGKKTFNAKRVKDGLKPIL